jgi:hypothetical protein
MRTLIQASLLLAFTLVVVTERSLALPAFARKYHMSCNVCHSPAPKLKPYGDEFAANGYKLKDKEPPRFTIDTGDDRLLLMRELPVALRLDGFARYLPQKSPESDIQWPFILKILSGGQIAKDVSYFLYFLFNEKGSIAGVEDAFIYLNNVANVGIDITVGQYQVADPIFKRELRPTFEDYEIYTIQPGDSRAGLAYDRGITLGYTLPTQTGLTLSVLNGNGIDAADAFDHFDSDPYKNLFARVVQPLGEQLQIGTLGYLGKERTAGVINDLQMVGGDATVSLGTIELALQYVYRSDTNPFFLAAGANKVATRGGFAQVMYAPKEDKSDWYLFLLYNKIDSDLSPLKYQTVTGNFTYLVARNFKLLGEYTYDAQNEAHRFTVGFMTAF